MSLRHADCVTLHAVQATAVTCAHACAGHFKSVFLRVHVCLHASSTACSHARILYRLHLRVKRDTTRTQSCMLLLTPLHATPRHSDVPLHTNAYACHPAGHAPAAACVHRRPRRWADQRWVTRAARTVLGAGEHFQLWFHHKVRLSVRPSVHPFVCLYVCLSD
jgi:hypothetical protein